VVRAREDGAAAGESGHVDEDVTTGEVGSGDMGPGDMGPRGFTADQLRALSRHGAFSQAELRVALGPVGLRAAVESGRLIGFGRGVLLDARRVLDQRTRAAAGLLLAGPEAMLVGPTAAALQGAAVLTSHAVHVQVPYHRRTRTRPGLVVHQGRAGPAELRLVAGLRTQRLPAALAEVLCVAARRSALAAVDQALHPLRPPARRALRAEIATALAGRVDRRGTRRAAALLDLATGRPETPEQSALLLGLVDTGLPVPETAHQVAGTAHRLTLAWPQAGLGVILTGAEDRHAADRREHRMRDLARRGWLVVPATGDDVADPTALAIRLRTRLRARRPAA
jgi:hypothetical protein